MLDVDSILKIILEIMRRNKDVLCCNLISFMLHLNSTA